MLPLLLIVMPPSSFISSTEEPGVKADSSALSLVADVDASPVVTTLAAVLALIVTPARGLVTVKLTMLPPATMWTWTSGGGLRSVFNLMGACAGAVMAIAAVRALAGAV